MLLLKLALAPTLILVASLAGRRWGVLVAGWIAGFPLTSGPVSIFLAVEQDLAFAAEAAAATLVGVIAMVSFCLTYARLALWTGALASLAGAIVVMLAAAGLLSLLDPGLPATVALLAATIALSLATIPHAPAAAAGAAPPWWDIPARMAVAAGLVVGLTEFADRLGPGLSGLLSPIPIFASVLAVFTHRQQGGKADCDICPCDDRLRPDQYDGTRPRSPSPGLAPSSLSRETTLTTTLPANPCLISCSSSASVFSACW
jgi:hypothetical protein